LRFELTFGSLLDYSPRGQTEVSKSSKRICLDIKGDKQGPQSPEAMIEFAVRRLSEELPTSARMLADLFGPDVVAVPVPSRRLIPPDGLWVPKRIAAAMAARGLVGSVRSILERTRAIPKSAVAPTGQRPTLDIHLDSLEANETEGLTRERFLIVDDVVTKGTTLYASALKLREAFPGSEIAAFALLRTRGRILEIERILDPCRGRILWDEEQRDVLREP
jgi:hypothetical protein